MARIAYPDPESMTADTQARLAKMGSLNVTRMMAHQEGLMLAYGKMGVELLRRGRLDPVLREAVILRVGQLCRSDYEWYQHESVARAVGMDEAMLRLIKAEDFEGLLEPFRVAIAFAEEIDADGAVSPDTFARAQGLFDSAELVELTILVGYYRMTAGFLRSFAIETEKIPLGAVM